MASANVKARCITCGKEKATSKCAGCLEDFCYKDLGDHRQELSKQLDEVEVIRDLFRQTVNEQKSDPQKHSLMQQIDKWEHDSIKRIRRTADEARESFYDHITVHFTEIESKLNKLTDQLRQSREDDNFFESDLRQWNNELTRLTEQLEKPANITLEQDQTPLINKLSVNVSSNTVLLRSADIGASSRHTQTGITVAGGNGKGNRLNQLFEPCGIFVDDDQTVYVADAGNDRIVEWKRGATNGEVVASGNGNGSRNDRLNRPTNVIVDEDSDCLIICDAENKRVVRWSRQMSTRGQIVISAVHGYGLAMDHNGDLYVSDIDKHEVKRWRIDDTIGTVVAGGNGQGNRPDQLSYPRYIFVDQARSVYVSDCNNDRVMKWREGAKEGVLVGGGRGTGNSLAQFDCPYGIIVDRSGAVYVADRNNNRIVRWSKGSTQGSIVVGGNGEGKQADQLCGPTGLSFDPQGNLYVVDWGNTRIQKFKINSN